MKRYCMTKIEPLLNIDDLMGIFGLSRISIYRKVAEARAGESQFPRPIWESKKKLRWSASDIENYIKVNTASQAPVAVTSSREKRKQAKSFQERQASARTVLAERHGIILNNSNKGGDL